MNIYVISELPGLPLRAREEAYAKAHPNKPQPQPLDTALLSTRWEGSKYSDDYSVCLSPSDSEDPSEKHLHAMGLAHRVQFSRGRITDIDRANRAIVISEQFVLEYDV